MSYSPSALSIVCSKMKSMNLVALRRATKRLQGAVDFNGSSKGSIVNSFETNEYGVTDAMTRRMGFPDIIAILDGEILRRNQELEDKKSEKTAEQTRFEKQCEKYAVGTEWYRFHDAFGNQQVKKVTVKHLEAPTHNDNIVVFLSDGSRFFDGPLDNNHLFKTKEECVTYLTKEIEKHTKEISRFQSAIESLASK